MKCDQCDKEFETEKQVRMHKLGAHRNVQKQSKENEIKTTNNQTSLTPEERAIAERVASQDTDWFAIGEESMNDFSLMVNPLNITKDNYPEAFRLQSEKKYVFRWCERTPKRIDELTRSVDPPLRWALVTRNNLPEMSRYVDDILGCVCKLDQALLFKPWAHNEMIKAAKKSMAEAQDNAGTLQGKKFQMQSRDEDVEIFEGKSHKISSSDEVMADEATFDEVGMGDLVEE